MAEGDERKTQVSRLPIRPEPLEVDSSVPFDGDRLDRKRHILNLTRILEGSESPYVIGLDAPWGMGKTSFIRIWNQHLRNEEYTTIAFNAWEVDYMSEPLVPLVGEIGEALEQTGGDSESFERVKLASGAFLRRALPIAVRLGTAGVVDLQERDLEDLSEGLGELAEKLTNDAIEEYQKQREEQVNFRTTLAEVVDSIRGTKPLVFFIDELDRCRPSFAVEVLERVKHLFEVKGVVFVLAIHRKQLANAIQAVYGHNFDGARYLDRFIDLPWRLPDPEPEKYCEVLADSLGDWGGKDKFLEVLVALRYYFGLDLRSLERAVARAAIVLHITSETELYEKSEKANMAGILAVFVCLEDLMPDELSRLLLEKLSGKGVLSEVQKRQATDRDVRRPPKTALNWFKIALKGWDLGKQGQSAIKQAEQKARRRTGGGTVHERRAIDVGRLHSSVRELLEAVRMTEGFELKS